MKYFRAPSDIEQRIALESTSVADRAMTIGRIIKSLRKNAGITQNEAAQIIGIARQTYAGYESGQHEPSVEILIRIANIYDVTMDYITGRHLMDIEAFECSQYLEDALPYIRSQFEQERRFINMVISQQKTASTEAEA